MKHYISESRAAYEDMYHGMFSRKLAEWAIENMKVKDIATKQMKRLMARSFEDVEGVLATYEVELPDEFMYTAWYLFNMALADYQKTCKNDEQRATFVEETLCDPDGMPENVLACFEAKMCNAKVPIYWEMFM